MTPEKIKEVIVKYRKALETAGYESNRAGGAVPCPSAVRGFNHILYMITKIEAFIREDRMDKVYRWLGFMQGVLWSHGFYSLDDLKNHNKKDEEYNGD